MPAAGQLRPALVAGALRRWLAQTAHIDLPSPECQLTAPAAIEPGALTRRPYFCSGCPHNTSTKVPDGSRALAGVGCHYMATWMNRNTSGLTQMGGEGADWIGLSRYTRTRHVFQNMGEGTYFHSGYLAIRQAIAAGANITYKILFNDAVAMTGGQPVDGSISVPQICQQMLGEGAKRVVITTDEPEKYRGVALAAGVAVHHRHDLDRLQRELREVAGVTILIHDQVCAAEKRRRRKKKAFPDPARRVFINTAVCEGCGDCGTQSNCLSLTPVETPFGRKRAIDQSSCNKDYSCVDGFCPSFVSVLGGAPRKGTRGTPDRDPWKELDGALPEPVFKTYRATCNIIAAGIGGTGIVTVGAILSMAAHLEGHAASILDITGLAQKGGAVISHIRLSNSAQSSGAVRIDAQQADVAIFCDAVAATNPETLAVLKHQHTLTVLNTYLAPTAEFTRDPDVDFNPEHLIQTIRAAAGASATHQINAQDLAARLFGDSIMANMMMLGFAWQSGAIPVSAAAIDQALVLNGVAAQANQEAFIAGRMLAHKPEALAQLARPEAQAVPVHFPELLAKIVERCRADLSAYQNAAYAKRYTDVVDAVLAAEQRCRPNAKPVLAVKVAQALHKLMAYKDEYEVARLFTNGEFRRELSEKFEGGFTLQFHMAPPLLARRDPATGIPRKISLGQGTEKVLAVLARCKTLRGTWLDIFGYSAERKIERKLIDDYRQAILAAAEKLDEGNFATLLALAELPQIVRGYGHIKMANIDQYQAKFKVLQERL